MGITGRLQLQAEATSHFRKHLGVVLGPQVVVHLLLCLAQLRGELAPGPSGKPRRFFQECHRNCSWGSVPGFVWSVYGQDRRLSSCSPNTAQVEISRQSVAVVPPSVREFHQGSRSTSLLSALLSIACSTCRGVS